MFLIRCKLTVAIWTRKNLAGYLLSLMAHIAKIEFSNTNSKKYMITFIIACVLFVVAIVAIASLFFESTVAGLAMPYLAVAEDGWGRCVCRRYATKQEAIDNLERLHDKL